MRNSYWLVSSWLRTFFLNWRKENVRQAESSDERKRNDRWAENIHVVDRRRKDKNVRKIHRELNDQCQYIDGKDDITSYCVYFTMYSQRKYSSISIINLVLIDQCKHLLYRKFQLWTKYFTWESLSNRPTERVSITSWQEIDKCQYVNKRTISIRNEGVDVIKCSWKWTYNLTYIWN